MIQLFFLPFGSVNSVQYFTISSAFDFPHQASHQNTTITLFVTAVVFLPLKPEVVGCAS